MLDYTGQTFTQFPFWTWTSTGSGAAPEPEVVSRAAGRSRRRRRRYIVEIDGQEFDVDSPDEAEALLTKARNIAQQVVAETRASIVIRPGVKVPQIRTPNKELVPIVKAAREEIRDLYKELKQELEIRALIARAEEEEEEAIIRLLM